MSEEQDQNDSTSLAATADLGAEMAELLEGLQWEVSFSHPVYAPAFPAVVMRAMKEMHRLEVGLINARSDKDRARLRPEHEEARARFLAACGEWAGATDALPLLRRMWGHYIEDERELPSEAWKFLDAIELLLDGGWAAASIEALFTAELGPLPDDLRAALAQLGKGQKEGDETAIATARLWFNILLPDHLRELMPAEGVGEP